MKRREFLKSAGVAFGALSLGAMPSFGQTPGSWCDTHRLLKDAIRDPYAKDYHLGLINPNGRIVGTGLIPQYNPNYLAADPPRFLGKSRNTTVEFQTRLDDPEAIDWDIPAVTTHDGALFIAEVKATEDALLSGVGLILNGKLLTSRPLPKKVEAKKGDTFDVSFQLDYHIKKEVVESFTWI